MPPEIAIDNELREAAEDVADAIRPTPTRRYCPPLTTAELEATTLKYQQECSECGGKLIDEDWQRDICPACGCVLLPF